MNETILAAASYKFRPYWAISQQVIRVELIRREFSGIVYFLVRRKRVDYAHFAWNESDLYKRQSTAEKYWRQWARVNESSGNYQAVSSMTKEQSDAAFEIANDQLDIDGLILA